MIKRKITGHKYISTRCEAGVFQVETDYLNDKIYLTAPGDECDPGEAEEFAKAILRASQDARKNRKKEG